MNPAKTQLSPATGAELKVLVKGFSMTERRLLEATSKLSERRPPRIVLVGDADTASADVVLLDATHPPVVQWAANQPWLAGKPAIWAGAKAVMEGHTAIDRHVQWPILPVLLYRAMEQHGARATAAAPAATAAPRSENRRVLVVDDSLAARAHLRSLLERVGLEVAEADRAEDGIAMAGQERFAFVMMDVLMPGIDGFEACRRIKAKSRVGQALPVVMLTSKSSPFDRVRGKMAGCDTYLTKPVDPVQLHEVIARHTGAHPAVRSTPAAASPAAGLSRFQPLAT